MVAPAKYRKTIDNGYDFNYYESFSISRTDFGDADGYANAYISLRGPVMSFYLVNSGGNPIEVSYNGNTLHSVIPANTTRLYSFRRISKIWFRAPSGTSTIDIEAWIHP